MTSYFLTGAGRGLGLEFARQLCAHPSTSTVFVTTRTIDPSPALASVIQGAPDGKIVHITCDVTIESNVARAAEVVRKHTGDSGLDVLINNVGDKTDSRPFKMTESTPAPDRTASMPKAELLKVFEGNVVSAHVVTAGLLDLLRKGKSKKVVNLTTTLSSFTLSKLYAWAPLPAYKLAKTALNMLTVQYALDYAAEGFTFIALSPGWVKSDLGSQNAHLTAEEGVKASIDTILNRMGPEKNGTLPKVLVPGWEDKPAPANYDGKDMPW